MFFVRRVKRKNAKKVEEVTGVRRAFTVGVEETEDDKRATGRRR